MKTLPHLLLLAIWICWIAYWIVAARGAKQTERRESITSRVSYQVPLILGAVMLSVPNILGSGLEGFFLPHTPALQWVGVGLTVLGLAFSVLARIRLGRNWSSDVTVKEEHELIRSGPYAVVRHPIYTGMLLALLGTAIAIGRWRALIGLALITAALLRKLAIEERFMRDTFGEAYARYRAEVPALVPFLF